MDTKRRFQSKSLKYYLVSVSIYILWVLLAIGFRVDHFIFIGIYTTCYFLTEWTHKLSWGLIFFIVFWILYDTMRVLPNYEVNPVHVQEIYDFEKWVFGFFCNGVCITPNEYFANYNNSYLDFMTGIFYLLWIPAPLAYAIHLFLKDKRMLIHFSAAFLLTNLIGFCIYYAYPAAPPWYVEYYGFDENFSIPGNAANLIKFDQLVGLNIFEGMYNKNANVFAAVPSLHAAYPLILFFYGLKKGYKSMSIIFFIIMIGIWFSAVYSLHHYIIDVILGIFCAIFAIFIFEKIILKSRINERIERFAKYIH